MAETLGDVQKDYTLAIQHKPLQVEIRKALEISAPFSLVEEISGKAMTIVVEANNKPKVEEVQKKAMQGIEDLSQELENQLIENFAKNFMDKHPNKVNLIQDKENIKVWNMKGLNDITGSRLYLVFKGDKLLDGYYDKNGNIILDREDLFLSFSKQLDNSDPRNKYRQSNLLHKESGEFIIEGDKIILKDEDGTIHQEGSDRFNYQIIALFIIG